MSAKTRIKQLEKQKPKAQKDTPVYQCILGEAVKVCWQSGRVTVQAEPMPNTKTYEGIDLTTCWDDDNDN